MLFAGVGALQNKSHSALQQYLSSEKKDGYHHHLSETKLWANIKCEYECCECVMQTNCCSCPCEGSGDSNAKADEAQKEVAKEAKKAIKAVKKEAASK